ncbi:MAG: 30S ribosome-binding factor RbfA [Clostridia bacterium]|nr:30S ribosome-binding factor RbfA [Clostridia bacterium]
MAKVDRVNEELCHLLNDTILYDLKDPRINNRFVTITAVVTSRDLKDAKAFVSTLNLEDLDEVVLILNQASTFIRKAMFDKVKLRYMPKFLFKRDPALDTLSVDKIITDIENELKNKKDED